MLTSAHILTIPSDLERFTFYIDASKYGLDAVLMQHGNIVVYASTQLKEHEKNYAMHNLQLAAVVFPRKGDTICIVSSAKFSHTLRS